MSRSRVVITELMAEAAVAQPRAHCDVLYDARLADERNRLAERTYVKVLKETK